ncbi:succinate-semialdehyde dehydrogenase (NADP(+)), partial [Shewanella sp. SR41-2]|nr:succinate-semialdehyde dehydrogenase (NADP(+)) [Shewanella sp. SR41-2]
MILNDPSLLHEQCYIDGLWVGANSGETVAIANPATQDIIGNVPVMGKAETEAAITAANNA